MAGMGASAGPGSFPALAIVLALCMLGYVVWTTDRLTSLARAKAIAADPDRNRGDPARNPGQQLPVAALAVASLPGTGRAVSPSAEAGTWYGNRAGGPVLAPKLAVCGKIAIGLTMGYMLILMI
jgi:hypothetical protein